MDLISREMAIDCLNTLSYKEPVTFAHAHYNHALADAMITITRLDAVEPKRGEWGRQTADEYDYWECSECGMGVGLDDVRNFCPNCGAKMEE